MAPHTAAARAAPEFLFATCQVGAERALKSEIARLWPAFHFAYSRPGFLTFKLPQGHGLPDDFDLRAVFARAFGFSLGKAADADIAARAASVWNIARDHSFDALHVWQRDLFALGHRGFEPSFTPEAYAAEEGLRACRPGTSTETQTALAHIAEIGQLVLDCVLVESNEWWVGYHRAVNSEACLPGGLREIDLPFDAVSRAYLKMEEALGWSALPIRPGDHFVEIGCSPGGASQALLNRGLKVTGIDPALVDPHVLAHANFTHIQKRGADVRRREFRDISWLAADMNVAPEYTLDTVEGIVTHSATNVRGLLLTLKLPDWELSEQIPAYLERIRGWGYAKVRARQLAHNRQEVCVTAVRSKGIKR